MGQPNIDGLGSPRRKETLVQQEDEEQKHLKMQAEMWAMHVGRCAQLGNDPYMTPIFDPTCQYYWDPAAGSWQRYDGNDPNLPVPSGYGGLGAFLGTQGRSVENVIDPLAPNNNPLNSDLHLLHNPLVQIPSDGNTPPQAIPLNIFPLSDERVSIASPPGLGLTLDSITAELFESLAIVLVPPTPITIQLPRKWRIAHDDKGQVYFYHSSVRLSQWELPINDETALDEKLGNIYDSDLSSSEDSDSYSSSESEDFSSEDDEEEEEEELADKLESSDLTVEKMMKSLQGKRRHSEALVQERVISPLLESDREAARKERKEAKDRAREEARMERREDRVTRRERDERAEREAKEERERVLEREVRFELKRKIEEKEALELIRARNKEKEELEKQRERVLEREAQYEFQMMKIEEREALEIIRARHKEKLRSALYDNSEFAKKMKETFRARMATYIVNVLNPYRRPDCYEGRITNTDDFKYLARKLTHFVMVKELKQLASIEDLDCSDSVKYKTKDFVRKYMSKFVPYFKRDPNDTKEY